MKRLFPFLAAVFLSALPPARAAVIPAASCDSQAVQNALASVAADNTTVLIPAGNCTWTTPLTYNQVYTTTLQGAGAQTPQGGSDQTILQDGYNHNGYDTGILNINTAAGKAFRLTGINFFFSSSNPSITYHGSLTISGPSQAVRLDHLHFNQGQNTQGGHSYWALLVVDALGVLDHSLLEGEGGPLIWAPSWAGRNSGHGSWADDTTLGSSRFFYVEDTTYTDGGMDCTFGGRFVFRHNTFNNTGLETHPTGGAGPDTRGCRAWEIYANTFNASNSNPYYNAYFLSSGTGVIWGNSAPTGYETFISLHSMRRNNSTYTESPTPGGWGYCGTSFSGAGSAWDQNSDTQTGYACIDQPGRGKGDLITGGMPNAVNSTTGKISWVNEALEPVYEWNDSWSPVPGYPYSIVGNSNPDVLAQNRDYYLGETPFNGATGVGSGLLSARPATCAPQVAYWATDTQTLYQCSATNTWTVYYAPYVYPHPLASGISSFSPCDLNQDGVTNVVDVQLEVNQALGVSPCVNDLNQDGVCNVIDVQRVVNAALGGACVAGP